MKILRYITTTIEEEIPVDLESFKSWEFSSGSSIGEDFKIFARLFRSYIKHNLPHGATLVNFSIGHYYISGFVQRNEKFAYFSISDVRYFPKDWHKKILIRTAQHIKDYTGGSNGYTALVNFKQGIEALL